jgi:hypothetical protein
MCGLLICSIFFDRLLQTQEEKMQLLAPLILIVGFSAALYKTLDVWPIAEYTLQKQGMHQAVAKDVTTLRGLVDKGQIAPKQAETMLQQKYAVN